MIFVVIILLLTGFYFFQRRDGFSIIMGLLLVSHGVNLSIFWLSKPGFALFSFITPEIQHFNDPLTQALVLTAVVIGFAFTVFLAALFVRAKKLFPDFEILEQEEED